MTHVLIPAVPSAQPVPPVPPPHGPPGPPADEGKGGHRLPRASLRPVAVVVAAALVGAASAAAVARVTGWGARTTVTTYVTTTNPQAPLDIRSLLTRALPTVVSVRATSTLTNPFFGPSGPGGALVTASGTGVVVTADGEVVTNNHVVSGASAITVTLNGSDTPLTAILVGHDASHDLALLKVTTATPLRPATFGDSSTAQAGDPVVAVGYALALTGGPTVTSGIVSASGRQVSSRDENGDVVTLTGMLQTDAAISSGNSGGPLLDAHGRVVGINTMVATSSGSSAATDIGFAIPSNTVTRLLPTLRSG